MIPLRPLDKAANRASRAIGWPELAADAVWADRAAELRVRSSPLPGHPPRWCDVRRARDPSQAKVGTRMDPLLTPLGLEAHRCPPPPTPREILETPLPIVRIDAGPPLYPPPTIDGACTDHIRQQAYELFRRAAA